MANIFDKAKSAIRKISDDVNKDKWDRNCINSALFTDPDPGKHVPPARQEGVPAPVPAGGVDPMRNPGTMAVQMGNSGGSKPIVAPAPEIMHSGEKPTIKPGLSGEQENKPVRFINPRFNRSINYVTSKVVMPGSNNVRSLADLPTVDPSQSISSIGGASPEGEAAASASVSAEVNSAAAAQQSVPAAGQSAPSPAVAAQVVMAKQAQQSAPAAGQSAPSPAVAAAQSMMAQQAQQPVPAAGQAAPSPEVAAAQAMMAKQAAVLPLSQPAAAGTSSPSPEVVAAQAMMAKQAAVLPLSQPAAGQSAPSPAVAAAQAVMAQQAQQPLSAAAAQPVPVVVTPSVAVAAVQSSPVAAAVQEDTAEGSKAGAEEAPAAEAAAGVEAAADEKCYYVLITHTKTYPAPGSRVLMRNCDSQYAWTNEKDESERPSYKVCPNCGKAIDIIETEMD